MAAVAAGPVVVAVDVPVAAVLGVVVAAVAVAVRTPQAVMAAGRHPVAVAGLRRAAVVRRVAVAALPLRAAGRRSADRQSRLQ